MRIPELYAKTVGVLFLFCSLLLLNGCAKMYGLKEDPKISVADIRIQEVKAMEGVFLIKLRVLNPNDVPLDIHGVNCDLEINQRHFASGIGDGSQTVPAFGTALVPVEVYASVLDMVASVADLLHSAGKLPSKDRPVPYTLKGTARIGIHGFKKDVPFNSSGELSLKGLALPH
ncbi:LEA type 2 family protein [Desulfobulbus elongatus]|uniref:LEA type 2 family protein n=1 Tax=Desulfobulbus elongatus TaxID=53332 RepID=UPI0006868E37|nr:LEA type 2 family protein [Desulfobulbus elongatus]